MPIAPDINGNPEIHYTRLFRIFQKWNAHGSFLHMFENSILALFENGQLDTSVIHGDGTTTLAKKGDDCIGFSGHKHWKPSRITVISRGTIVFKKCYEANWINSYQYHHELGLGV